MSTQNQNNPQRGTSNTGSQASRSEPTTGNKAERSSDSRNLSGSNPGQTQGQGQRDESEILRCLDAIDQSVRECRTAMGNQGGELGSSRSSSSSKQQGASWRSDEARDESSRDESGRSQDRNNPSR